jgi:hypothetical protein
MMMMMRRDNNNCNGNGNGNGNSNGNGGGILSSLDVQVLVDRLFVPLFGTGTSCSPSTREQQVRSSIDEHVLYIAGVCDAQGLAYIVDTHQAHVALRN